MNYFQSCKTTPGLGYITLPIVNIVLTTEQLTELYQWSLEMTKETFIQKIENFGAEIRGQYLFKFATQFSLEELKIVLEWIPVNSSDLQLNTLAHVYANYADYDRLKIVVDKGADLKIKNISALTPLEVLEAHGKNGKDYRKCLEILSPLPQLKVEIDKLPPPDREILFKVGVPIGKDLLGVVTYYATNGLAEALKAILKLNPPMTSDQKKEILNQMITGVKNYDCFKLILDYEPLTFVQQVTNNPYLLGDKEFMAKYKDIILKMSPEDLTRALNTMLKL